MWWNREHSALTIVPSGSDSVGEPVSLDDAKTYLRVDYTDQDTLIQSLITSARQTCENDLHRAIPLTTFQLQLDRFPLFREAIRLPVPPLAAVDSITYLDITGTQQTLDPSQYLVDTSSEPGRITPAFGCQWPGVQDQINTVQIQFIAGYATVPEGIKTAIKLWVDCWYENRNPQDVVEKTVCALLAPFQWGSYS
jgi:uncharacterized phiE125 gp8 family phage protein